MKLIVNGEERVLDRDGVTVLDLLAELAVDGPVAVERNGEVIPRALHASTVLSPGDNIEVVHFVGGG